jgi:magnesium chelatase subunit I
MRALRDVVGGIDERAANDRNETQTRHSGTPDGNVLYVDEVNMLNNEIVNAFLDASATGSFTVRRGPITATYRSKFTLIGSMNPEEGNLRAQIMDRFGLRVIVNGLNAPQERLEAYRRVCAYRENPRGFLAQYADETAVAAQEIVRAREILHQFRFQKPAAGRVQLILTLNITSLRAEISLFEAAAPGRLRKSD